MVAHHQHIEMFGNRVDRVGPCWIGGGGQNIGQTRHFDDIGCMAAACTFGVEGVNGAAFESGNGSFNETGLI